MKGLTGTGKAGFTLMEVMVASTISVIVIAGVTAAFIEGLKIWQQEETRNELNFDIEKAMERIRLDLRLSSVGSDLMAFYPATADKYTAISFPLSVSSTADGYVQRDASNRVVWNQTVIYHVRPGTPDKLLRTVYSPRCTTASTAQRYQQLCDVVAATDKAGLDAARLGSEVCASKTVFENLVEVSFLSSENRFDCYWPTNRAGGTHKFGSLVLSGGPHRIQLIVTNKNANSSGYYVPIDKVSLSASSPGEDPAGDLDAELFYPITTHPSGSPCFSYTISGGSVTNMQVDASYNWSGNAGLLFKATAAGQALTLYVTNDCFVDNNFERPNRQSSGCEVVITNVIGTASCYPADTVVQLKKGDTWITDHVGSNMGPAVADSLTTISNMMYGTAEEPPDACLLLNGCWARFWFDRGGSNFSLFLTNVQVCVDDDAMTGTNITFNGGQNFLYMSYTGPMRTNSDWLPMWEIDRTSNYVVRFETMNTGDKDYDLFVSQGATRTVCFWRNEGTTNAYSFPTVSNNWAGLSDAYLSQGLAFGDLDGDGDYDLLIGTRYVGSPYHPSLAYWKNVGDRSRMELQFEANIPFCNCGWSRPCLVDFNADGKLDMFMCHQSGNPYLAINVGTRESPSWPTATNYCQAPTPAIVAGVPAVADIDNDGKLELFSGCATNWIYCWTNAGTVASPNFRLVTNGPYADILHAGTNTAPTFCDINGDGLQDLFIGASNGEVWYYRNTGTLQNALWAPPVTNFAVLPVGGIATPTFCNIDNDFNALAWWQGSTNVIYSAWNANPPTRDFYGLSRVEVGYPVFAKFYSRVYDTRMGTAYFRKLNYTGFKDQAKGGDLWLYVRSGNSPDLTSRPWVGPFLSGVDESLSAVLPARFVQYQAGLECGYNDVISAFTNTPTAVLRDVTIDWPAAQGLVDLEVTFGQTTNGGVVTATVDGLTMVSSVQVEMTIYKASRTGKGNIETNTASGVLEVTPLNTGR